MFIKCYNQCCCCGSMTFCYGSGSGDPCLWLMDPHSNPDPTIYYFRHWPSRLQQKTTVNFFNVFLLTNFWRYRTFTTFFQNKKSKKKKSQNSKNQGFTYYFFAWLEGSGSGSRSIPALTNVSGSRRPKNIGKDPTDPDSDPQQWL